MSEGDSAAVEPLSEAEFRERLFALNVWADGLTVPKVKEDSWNDHDPAVQAFRAARRHACIARLEAGEWETWAQALLVLRAHAPQGDDATNLFAALAHADFTEVCFDSPGQEPGDSSKRISSNPPPKSYPATVDFRGARFAGVENFRGAQFAGEAFFRGARFGAVADFQGARFEGWADFQGARFAQRAHFQGAQFSERAVFRGAQFSERADFRATRFEGDTVFASAEFKAMAVFTAVQGREGSSISFEQALFEEVPDFIQASFQRAPRLDNIRVEPKRDKRRGVEITARWRALRGLALDGNDHERERDFFAEETLSQRLVTHTPYPWFFWTRTVTRWETVEGERKRVERKLRRIWPGAGAYWAGVFYSMLSDFGRSMLRPLLGLALLTALFAGAYLHQHLALRPEAPQGLPGYLAAALSEEGAPPLACEKGDGAPLGQALQLSLSKALVLGGLIDANASLRTQACLFGLTRLDSDSRAVPATPPVVTALSALQVVLSAVLIFLFLQAVRNTFRLR